MTSRTALLRRSGAARDGRGYLIRPSRAEDAQDLVALRDSIAAEGEWIAAVPGERSVLEEHLALAALLTGGGLSLTLEVEGRIQGQLTAHREVAAAPASSAEISIAVHNAARGVGLGRALMEVAIEWARAVRLDRLTLGVFPNNAPAIRLYRSVGFVDQSPALQRVILPTGTHELLLMSLEP